ncbi:MAG: hypothetical protein HKN73_02575 [Gemmatimonadetes bacterium]|nr:hypothetical protein [Gemmatimonadota bacterium]
MNTPTSSGDSQASPTSGEPQTGSTGPPTDAPVVISETQGELVEVTLSQRLEALSWDSSRFQLTGDIVSGASDTRQDFFTGNATLTLVVCDRGDGTTRRLVVSVGDGQTPGRVARGEAAAERAAVVAVAEMAVDSVGGGVGR